MMLSILLILNVFISVAIIYFSSRYPRFVQLSWLEQSFHVVKNYRPSLHIKDPVKVSYKFKLNVLSKLNRKRIYLSLLFMEVFTCVSATNYHDNSTLIFLTIFAIYTLSIAWIDLDHKYIFDSMSITLLWIGLLLNLNHAFANIEDAVVGAIFGYTIIYLINIFYRLVAKKDGLGLGDAKLIAAIGAWFGWKIIGLTLFIAGLLLFVTYIYFLFSPLNKRSNSIGFGPFLVIGAWVSLQIIPMMSYQ
ncbi:prepilin peptidase [Cysteiniphilum halobium]|uniref:prepilin peptidase n=1 Tax=Cysteiniphilum halobium TaxID=2219059 RepID=UPI003F873870